LARKIEGILPVLCTPFTKKGELDEKSLRRLVNFEIEKRVHGLTIHGIHSEFYKLSDEERNRITDIVIEEVNGRLPVVAGAGHSGIAGAVKMCKYAHDAGADAVMLLPPFFMKPDAQGLYDFYKKISDSVDIPIMIQDAPAATGVPISAAQMAKWAEEIENVKYAKIEDVAPMIKISETIRLTKGKFTILTGSGGRWLLQALTRGARGCLPGDSLPELWVELFNRFEGGDTRGARGVYYRLLPYIDFSNEPRFTMIEKEILRLRGVIATSRVRDWSLPMDDLYDQELRVVLRSLGIPSTRR
jgi:4-hydroxy-tetrahydrodipicolinate synthase